MAANIERRIRALATLGVVLAVAAAGGFLLLGPGGGDAPGGGAGPGVEARAPAGAVDGRLVDLTHAFDDEAVYWPTARGFHLEVVADGMTEGGYYYRAARFSAAEHGGTHLDAPVHFAEGRWTSEEIPVERLVGPAAVVDVSDAADADPDYRVDVDDLRGWEEEHGRIPDGAIVLLNTGRSELWPDAEAYMGTAGRGEEAVAELHFPGLHPDAARWLVENRSVAAVGLDTPSIDYGQSGDFMSHRILYEANVYGLENVARLDALPPVGATVWALPMKIRGGSGGPVRIVAAVPE